MKVGDVVVIGNEDGHCFRKGQIGEIVEVHDPFLDVEVNGFSQLLYPYQLLVVNRMEELDDELYI